MPFTNETINQIFNNVKTGITGVDLQSGSQCGFPCLYHKSDYPDINILIFIWLNRIRVQLINYGNKQVVDYSISIDDVNVNDVILKVNTFIQPVFKDAETK